MIAPARLAAYGVLRAVNGSRVDLPAALVSIRNDLSDDRDRALAGEIATGTLRWQGAFDHVIAEFSGRSIDRLDPEIVDILRLTLFQILHLDRVPASAAVNDAVDLARKAGKRSAAPLVNALLRRASRERDRFPLPPRLPGRQEDELSYLSITLSHPRWLVARWRDRHGFDAAEAWCRFNNQGASLTLRANLLRITRDGLAAQLAQAGVETRPTRFAPHGLVVVQGNPLRTPLADDGLFVVQDEASQLVAEAVEVRPGERVFDACASPGGKTTALAARMEDRGLIVAADVRPRRMRLLRQAIRAAGTRSVRLVQADAAAGLPFGGVFDCVLVDAPCSGLGAIRRDPDVKWRRGEHELEALADRQLRMITEAAAVLRPGGRLVYATCSSEPEENERVLRRFLERTPAFAPQPLPLALSEGPALVDEEGHLRTLPFRHGLEAFFAGAVVKRP